ncbi:unnamed protein product [Schistosoma turkestanicum]|nr:unnamed protein product [Schistosoma turkestanicum]
MYKFDFSRFAQSDFNHIHWINEALKSCAPDPNHLDQKASDLVLQLQTQMKDVMQTLDHTCQEAIVSIPRVLREIDAVRIDALTLEADLKTLQQDNLQLNEKSQNIVNSLVELDRTRKNAQSAADALRETDRWNNLMQCIDDLFEIGDLDQLCSNIEGMNQCLASFIHLNDYNERVKQVDKYKNNFESLIAPKLIQSLDNLNNYMMSNSNTSYILFNHENTPHLPINNDDDDMNKLTTNDHIELTNHLIHLLCRIGRENATRKYYFNWLKEQVNGFWDRSICQSTETATTTTTTTNTTVQSDSLPWMVVALPFIIQKLSAYQSKLFTNNQRTKLNCLPISHDHQLNSDQSSIINNIIYFYALLICFFNGQLNAKLFFHSEEDQFDHSQQQHQEEGEQHHQQQQKTRQSFPIDLMTAFINSLESCKPFQTLTNTITDYQLIGCLFRVTIGCLQCLEELLVPFYSEVTKRTLNSKNTTPSLLINTNEINHHENDQNINIMDNYFKSTFIRLIQVFIEPFKNLPELFTKFIREQFDCKLNELNITVDNTDPSDLLEKLNNNIVQQSISLFYDTIHLCFEETGAIAIPSILDIIQNYWDTLIAKWIIWNTWIEKLLTKIDMESNYHQAYGFMWILKFAHLTGEFTAQSNVFVEYVMSKCSDWLSFILNSSDNIFIHDRTIINHIPNTNQININDEDTNCMPIISGCVLYQLILKQSIDCQQAIQSLVHSSSNLLNSLNKSKSHGNLNGVHRSNAMLCRSTIGVVREIALKPIRYYLKSVPNLNIWFTYPNNGEECLPDLAYLPQDYITQIGQYLFMLPAQLEPYMSSMNDLNLVTQLTTTTTTDQTIMPSISSISNNDSGGAGLTYCFQLGDSDVIYSMISHKINQNTKHQQHDQEEAGSNNAQTKLTTISTSSNRTRQLSNNFNQFKQTILTGDEHNNNNSKSSMEISSIYCWLENLISVNVCDLIVNTLLKIGMNKSTIKSSMASTTTTTTTSSKLSKSAKGPLKRNTNVHDTANESDDDDDDSVEDQPLLTKHGLKQLDIDLGYLFSMLHDLGVNVPGNLQTLRDLINCDIDQFPRLCADRPPKIVNAVANFRGF